MHLSAPGLEFAAYVALYPDCTYTYLEDEDTAAKPVRIFQGSADNYNPVAPCRAYVQPLRAKGKDIQLTEYSGANHVFDWRALTPSVTLQQAQSTRNCQEVEAKEGQILNAKTKQPFTYNDPCVERGVTTGYDEKAATQARNAIMELTASVLKP